MSALLPKLPNHGNLRCLRSFNKSCPEHTLPTSVTQHALFPSQSCVMVGGAALAALMEEMKADVGSPPPPSHVMDAALTSIAAVARKRMQGDSQEAAHLREAVQQVAMAPGQLQYAGPAAWTEFTALAAMHYSKSEALVPG